MAAVMRFYRLAACWMLRLASPRAAQGGRVDYPLPEPAPETFRLLPVWSKPCFLDMPFLWKRIGWSRLSVLEMILSGYIIVTAQDIKSFLAIAWHNIQCCPSCCPGTSTSCSLPRWSLHRLTYQTLKSSFAWQSCHERAMST